MRIKTFAINLRKYAAILMDKKTLKTSINNIKMINESFLKVWPF